MPGLGNVTRENARENFIVVVKDNNPTGTTAKTFVNAVSSSATLTTAGAARDIVDGDYLDLGAINDAASAIRPVVISNGRKIKQLENKYFVPGNYSIQWNASELSTGVYFVNIIMTLYSFISIQYLFLSLICVNLSNSLIAISILISSA